MRLLHLAFFTYANQGRDEQHKDPAWGAYRVLDQTSQLCTRFCRKLRRDDVRQGFAGDEGYKISMPSGIRECKGRRKPKDPIYCRISGLQHSTWHLQKRMCLFLKEAPPRSENSTSFLSDRPPIKSMLSMLIHAQLAKYSFLCRTLCLGGVWHHPLGESGGGEKW